MEIFKISRFSRQIVNGNAVDQVIYECPPNAYARVTIRMYGIYATIRLHSGVAGITHQNYTMNDPIVELKMFPGQRLLYANSTTQSGYDVGVIEMSDWD